MVLPLHFLCIVFDKQESSTYKAHLFFDMVEYCPRLASTGKAKCAESNDEGYCNVPGIPAQSPELGAAFIRFVTLMVRHIGFKLVVFVAGGGAVLSVMDLKEVKDNVFLSLFLMFSL
jgi:hypothetical protein